MILLIIIKHLNFFFLLKITSIDIVSCYFQNKIISKISFNVPYIYNHHRLFLIIILRNNLIYRKLIGFIDQLEFYHNMIDF
jgi:hypothetical protein